MDAETFTDQKVINLSEQFVNLKVNPESGPEHQAAGAKYGITGFPTVAFLDAQGELISLNSGYRPATDFAELMESTLKGEEKLKLLKVAIQKNPNDAKLNAELAQIHAERGQIEKAKPLFDQAVTLDPDNKTGLLPQLHITLGLQYGQNAQGEHAEAYFQAAEKHFTTVIEKYTQSDVYEPAHYYLGVTYAIQEKFELSIATLEKLNDAKDPDTKAAAAHMLDRVRSMMNQ